MHVVTDDKPASVETCPDCGRPRATDFDQRDVCHFGGGSRDCQELTIANLRAEVESLRLEMSASGLQKREDLDAELQTIDDIVEECGGKREQGGASFIREQHAEVAALRARVGEPSLADIVRNGGNQEWLLRLIESTRKGECYNCGGDGHLMWLDGPRVCVRCDGTGKLPAPPSAPEATAQKDGE
jgi:hypothetical protein